MNLLRYDIELLSNKTVVWGKDRTVVALCLDSGEVCAFEANLRKVAVIEGMGSPKDPIPRALAEYSKTGKFSTPLKAVPLWGTPFQRKVWAALRSLPDGQLITYGELARKLENPRAARAIGGAVGANPIAIIIPCHRVVAKNGLGGFGRDIGLKVKLLAVEGLSLS